VVNLGLSNYQDNLASGETTPAGTGSLASGIGIGMSLSAPGVGNDGSVDLLYDLDAAGLSFLKPGGVNPAAKATFGIFKGNERLIYMRESVQ
jgi:MSHA biogenesis protein MshQ